MHNAFEIFSERPMFMLITFSVRTRTNAVRSFRGRDDPTPLHVVVL